MQLCGFETYLSLLDYGVPDLVKIFNKSTMDVIAALSDM